MPVTNYHTLNGELLGETGPGGRRFYGKDALGSVVATYDQNGTLENTYRYKPYGGLLSKTGSAPDPRFMWTGSTGSRTTGASYAEQYNRARHYESRQAGWTSVDALWPFQAAYCYSDSAPTQQLDPSGYSTCREACCRCVTKVCILVIRKQGFPNWGPVDKIQTAKQKANFFGFQFLTYVTYKEHVPASGSGGSALFRQIEHWDVDLQGEKYTGPAIQGEGLSLGQKDLKDCLERIPSGCSADLTCTLRDFPGLSAYSLNDSYIGPGHFNIDFSSGVVLAFQPPGCDCPAPEVRWSMRITLPDKVTYDKEPRPIVWTPSAPYIFKCS